MATKLKDLLKKVKSQNFGPKDSLLISSLVHPLDATRNLGDYLSDQAYNAGNAPILPYSDPYQAESSANSAFNLAGMMQTGSMPYAPKSSGGTLGTFIGPNSKTWDKKAAEEALKLLDSGTTPEQVWNSHMIGRMPDGSLFSEIDDIGSKYVSPRKFGSYLGDTLLDSKALDGYPKLNYINTKEAKSSFYDNKTKNNIGIKETSKNKKSVALHELQHAIQNTEQWPTGGAPNNITEDMFSNDFIKKINAYRSVIGSNPHAEQSIENLIKEAKIDGYYRLFGEAQARATQDRMNMNMEERMKNYPFKGGYFSSYPLKDLIVKYK